MFATACAAPSVAEEVGYHGLRRNALGDIFENLDVPQMALKVLSPRPAAKTNITATSTKSSDSRRRRLAEGWGAVSEKAHFAGSCWQGGLDTNGNTRVLDRRQGGKATGRTASFSSFSSSSTQQPHSNLGNRKSAPLTYKMPAFAPHGALANSNTATTNAAINSKAVHNACLSQADYSHLITAQCPTPDNNCSNLQQHSNNNGSSSNSNTKSSSTAHTAFSERRNSSKAVNRGGSLCSEQNDSFSSSMAHLRAKDCAKRSMVC